MATGQTLTRECHQNFCRTGELPALHSEQKRAGTCSELKTFRSGVSHQTQATNPSQSKSHWLSQSSPRKRERERERERRRSRKQPAAVERFSEHRELYARFEFIHIGQQPLVTIYVAVGKLFAFRLQFFLTPATDRIRQIFLRDGLSRSRAAAPCRGILKSATTSLTDLQTTSAQSFYLVAVTTTSTRRSGCRQATSAVVRLLPRQSPGLVTGIVSPLPTAAILFASTPPALIR